LLQSLRRLMSSEYSMVFCLCLCMLFSLTYEDWLVFDINNSVDPKTYWGLAHFDFEQSVVRKYRVLEPFSVAAMNWVLVSVARLFKPGAFSGDYSMRLCFYIFNMGASAMFCTLSYAYVRSLNRSKAAALVVALMIVTAKWTVINTAAFMADSLFCCFIALTFLGISRKNTAMLFWSVLLAPFSKEAYLFMLPVIFLFSHVPKLKILGWFVLSAAITFTFRYAYDRLTGHPMGESLGQDTEHFTYVLNNSKRFLQPDFMNPLKALIGLWLFIPLGAMLLIKGFARQLAGQVKPYMIVWLLLVVLQMLMSGDLARMFYLYLPVYGFFVAYAIDAWRQQNRTLAQ
jgi:hypothetical protein